MADVIMALGERERAVTLEVGDTLHVMITSDRANDNRWSVDYAGDLLLVLLPEDPPRSSERRPARTVRTIRLRARRPGVARVAFVRQPDARQTDEQRYHLSISIEECPDERS